MARPNINLHGKICDLLSHTGPLLPEAEYPLSHFEQSANVGNSLIKYLEDHIDEAGVYDAVYQRHFAQLRRFVLADLIESFERFLKELAAVAIDVLAPYAVDDRFDDFVPRGGSVAAFVNAKSIGKALCESSTWLNSADVNNRFRTLLKEPFGNDWEFLFPFATQSPAGERARAKTLNILWQIRHNLAHNVGMMTDSDAMKLRMLIAGPVEARRRLAPLADDLRYVKRFLTETARHTNLRVANRLGQLLTVFHQQDAGLFVAQEKANEVSRMLQIPVVVNGQQGLI